MSSDSKALTDSALIVRCCMVDGNSSRGVCISLCPSSCDDPRTAECEGMTPFLSVPCRREFDGMGASLRYRKSG